MIRPEVFKAVKFIRDCEVDSEKTFCHCNHDCACDGDCSCENYCRKLEGCGVTCWTDYESF